MRVLSARLTNLVFGSDTSRISLSFSQRKTANLASLLVVVFSRVLFYQLET